MDFTPRESQLIGAIMQAERSLPDEFWHVPAVQELACVVAAYEAVMSADHIASLIGCGALLARHGNAEMKAEIMAKLAIARASPSNRPEDS